MDIFVLGSKETPTYIDTFPLVVAQAMTMGLPVVGSISGAIPYQLGGKGLLFPEGDAECLQQHLEHLIQESDARQLMGAALRERALEHFCIDAMNERFIEFVEHEVGA
jgi:glycosyltransferase involved in cell wall biosynthesis